MVYIWKRIKIIYINIKRLGIPNYIFSHFYLFSAYFF